jgi:hypothetical protein
MPCRYHGGTGQATASAPRGLVSSPSGKSKVGYPTDPAAGKERALVVLKSSEHCASDGVEPREISRI